MNSINYFILSQILVSIAMIFDLLSFQYKEKKKTFLCFIISASLISLHYFLLFKIAAWVIVFLSILRFITCYFIANQKYLYLFISLNTVALFFTYKGVYDLIIYVWILFIIIWNFQKNNKDMRRIMMIWTSIVILYNFIIYSPMWVVLEWTFLLSNIIWYYRHYIRPKNDKKNS